MGGSTTRTSATRLEALQVQSSARGVTVPWVRGVTRVAVNLGWYNGFTATEQVESQGGKGASVESVSYTYAADIILLAARGPIIDFPRVWVGKEVFGSAFAGSLLAISTESYTVPSGGGTYTVTNAANFLAVLQVTTPRTAGGPMTLADGRHYRVTSGGQIVFFAEAQNLPVSITYQRRTGTINRPALTARGLSFFAGHIGQSAWSGLAAYAGESRNYSGWGYIAAAQYPLTTSASLENHLLEVVGPMAYHLGSSIPDVDPALFLREILTDTRDGASFPSERLGDLARFSDYCVASGLLISPAITTQTTAAEVVRTAADLGNSLISTTGGVLQLLPRGDRAESGNGRTYTPNLTPVFDLTDECYIAEKGAAPIEYRRRGEERYNTWSLEYRNRANAYAPEPIDAKDTADIAERGVRANPSAITAHWVCDTNVALRAVQLAMQRSVSVLYEYEFTLPPHYSAIDLGDIVTLTDAAIGLDRLPVMVIGIVEEATGHLRVTAEDYPIGSASAAIINGPDSLGYQPNFNVAPGSIDPPIIFEGPAQRAAPSGVEVYIAARGGNPNWGGCHIWTSLDGTDYRLLATIYGPARYGAAAAALAAGATSMQVDGLGSAQLLTGTTQDAQQLVTLCWLGGTQGEFLAHAGATLTGPGAYTLAGLVRGAYESPNAAHADNDPFVRIDERVARSGPLDRSMVGQQLHIKACSFNIYGAATQGLADVSAYTYTVTGQPASYHPGIAGAGLDLQASALLFKYPAVGSPSPASITLTAVRKGGLAGTVAFSVTSGTATLTGSGDTRTLTAANLTSTTATIRATVTDPVATYTSDATISKVYDGLDGGSAQMMRVEATPRQAFAFDGSGVAVPAVQTITFTALLQNLTGTATWACERFDQTGASLGTVTMGGSGNARTLTVAQFGAAQYAEITATLSPFTDTVSVVRLKDGAGNVQFDLSNDSHTFPADASGNVLSYAGASAKVTVWEGLVDTTATWTVSKVDSSGVTSSVSGDTVTVSSMTAATVTGQVDVTVSKAGFASQTKPFKLLKAKSAPGAYGVLSGVKAIATETDLVSPYAMDCQVKFTKNGTITRTGDITTQLLWYEPQTTNIGDSHWIKVVQLSEVGGGNTFTGTLNTVQALSTDRTYRLRGANNMDKSLKYYIYSDAAGTVLVGSGTIDLYNANGL